MAFSRIRNLCSLPDIFTDAPSASISLNKEFYTYKLPALTSPFYIRTTTGVYSYIKKLTRQTPITPIEQWIESQQRTVLIERFHSRDQWP